MKYLIKARGLLHSNYVFNLYLFAILFFLITFAGTRFNFIFFSSQILIILLCTIFISERPGLNLSTSFYGFTLIFLGIFPIAEFKLEIIYWSGRYLADIRYIEASLLVLLSLIAFRFSYGINLKFKSKINSNKVFFVKTLKFLPIKTFIFLAIPCIYILSAYNYDIIALQFRGLGEEIETVFIFEFFFIKPLIFNIIFFNLLVLKNSTTNSNKKILLFYLILLFFVNPLSVPRFLAFSLYVPLIFVIKNYYFKKNYSYLNVIFFGMIFIFPILDIFRWFKTENKLDLSQNMNLDYFFAGHFDAFQNLARTIDLNYHTYGYQFIGALFFFIPRAIWTNKPVGSGFLLADQAHLSFNNISMPLVSELYLDFSYIGVILGFLLLGFIYRYIDNRMLVFKKLDNYTNIIKLIAYTEFCCLQFYLLRGNLLACTAFITSILASIFLVYIYYNIFYKSLKILLNAIK
jgi:hypothetical protein